MAPSLAVEGSIDSVLDWLATDERFADIEAKESYVAENPFYRTKVKLKKEIVTMGGRGYRSYSYRWHLC